MNIQTYKEIEHAKRAYLYHLKMCRECEQADHILLFNKRYFHLHLYEHYARILRLHGIVNHGIEGNEKEDRYANGDWISDHQSHALRLKAWHRLVDQYWLIPF
jgi:hypothetical protein